MGCTIALPDASKIDWKRFFDKKSSSISKLLNSNKFIDLKGKSMK